LKKNLIRPFSLGLGPWSWAWAWLAGCGTRSEEEGKSTRGHREQAKPQLTERATRWPQGGKNATDEHEKTQAGHGITKTHNSAKKKRAQDTPRSEREPGLGETRGARWTLERTARYIQEGAGR